MSQATITIPVDETTAKAYAQASEEQRRKIQLLLSLRVRDLAIMPPTSLKAVMDDLATKAASRGLTEETLESLLRGL